VCPAWRSTGWSMRHMPNSSANVRGWGACSSGRHPSLQSGQYAGWSTRRGCSDQRFSPAASRRLRCRRGLATRPRVAKPPGSTRRVPLSGRPACGRCGARLLGSVCGYVAVPGAMSGTSRAQRAQGVDRRQALLFMARRRRQSSGRSAIGRRSRGTCCAAGSSLW